MPEFQAILTYRAETNQRQLVLEENLYANKACYRLIE